MAAPRRFRTVEFETAEAMGVLAEGSPAGHTLAELGAYLTGLIDRLEDLLAHYTDLITTLTGGEEGYVEPDAESHTEED